MKSILIISIILWSASSFAGGLGHLGIRSEQPKIQLDLIGLQVKNPSIDDEDNTASYVAKPSPAVGLASKIGSYNFDISKTDPSPNSPSYYGFNIGWTGDRSLFNFGLTQIEGVQLAPKSKRDENSGSIDYSSASLELTFTIIKFRLGLDDAFDKASHPKSSGGGVIGVLAGNWDRITAKETIIPHHLQAAYGSDNSIQEGQFQTIHSQFGWAQNFVLETLYLSFLAVGGPGVSAAKYRVSDQPIDILAHSNKSSFIGKIGYSSSTAFFTLVSSQTISNSRLRSSWLRRSKSSISANFGMNF